MNVFLLVLRQNISDMKRIIGLLLTLTLACGVISAQTADGRGVNEISLSYGRASIPGTVYTLGGVFGSIFSFGLAAPSTISTTGAIGFEYMRFVHPHVAVGFLADYECFTLGFKTVSSEKDPETGKSIYKPSSKGCNHIASLMPAAKFPWFSYDHVSMYSKLAVGAMYTHTLTYKVDGNNDYIIENGHRVLDNSSSQWSWACQVNPVGVDFGGQLCRGFAELGWGMQGLIMLGVRFNFD